MEDIQKNEGNKPMPDHPKPADNVQMHIETVIPEAEKETLPPPETEKETVVSADNDITKSTGNHPHKEQNHNFEKVKDPDARDQIETVDQ